MSTNLNKNVRLKNGCFIKKKVLDQRKAALAAISVSKQKCPMEEMDEKKVYSVLWN